MRALLRESSMRKCRSTWRSPDISCTGMLSNPNVMVPLQMGLTAMVVLLDVRGAHQIEASPFRRRPESIWVRSRNQEAWIPACAGVTDRGYPLPLRQCLSHFVEALPRILLQCLQSPRDRGEGVLRARFQSRQFFPAQRCRDAGTGAGAHAIRRHRRGTARVPQVVHEDAALATILGRDRHEVFR